MASFETFGVDDTLIPESYEVDCPACEKPIEISLNRDSDIIICPHCSEKIKIESS